MTIIDTKNIRTKYIWIIAGFTVLAASSVAHARAAYDPMRCEALMLQRESKMQMCLSKCERKVINRKNFDGAACDDTCRTRYDRAVDRLGRRAACTPPSADPHQCEAQALKVEARHLICGSACERKGQRPGFDVGLCDSICNDWCDIAADEVLASPICADGRIVSDAPGGQESDESDESDESGESQESDEEPDTNSDDESAAE